MAEARVNGVTLNYRQTGKGPDVVLIHGLGANQAFWNFALVTALARTFRVTTFDLRGHGYSETAPAGYRPVDLAADLCGLLDHVGAERVHLIGHSYGGLAAIHFALAHPARALSLTIADTRIRSLQPKQAVTEAAAWPAIRTALGEHGIIIDENESEIGFALFEALATMHWDKAAQLPAEQFAYVPFGGGNTRSARRWQQLAAQTTLKQDCREGLYVAIEDLLRLRLPTLAVYGELSPTRSGGEKLGTLLADCRLNIVPGAGHFHPATHPEMFLRTIQEFLHAIAR